MSACRADLKAKALRLAAAGLFAVASSPAWAQEPIRLTPLDPMPFEFRPFEPARGLRGPAGVQVQDLKAPSPESVGVLDSRQGGFAHDMWKGTPAALVRKLMPMLPGATASHVLHDLQRRLLLTAAAAPEGVESRAGGPSLVEMRAEQLMAMGEVDGVAALGNAAPIAASGPVLARLKIDAMLAAGNAEGACAEAALGLSVGRDGDLAKVQVFCNMAAGRMAEGNMGLDLLRERKDVDHAFQIAAEVMGGLPPVPADKLVLAQATPLHVATFSAAKLPLPAAAVASAPPSLLKAVALSPSMSPDQRLAAAERAESLGVMDAEEVRKLYAGVAFSVEEVSGVMARADAGGPRVRALLYRVAGDMADQGVKAQIVGKALDLATIRGDFASAARIFAPLLAAIRPVPDHAGLAAAAAKAQYALGRGEAADKWLDIARGGPDSRAADRLWPYAAIHAAGGQQAIATPAYAAWRATQEGVPAELAARRSALVLGVLAGLGADVPDGAWLDAIDLPAGGPKPGLFALMQGGALDARIGVTVLAALAAIGDTPLSKADPLTLSETISALAVVGLTEDARALAVEILLANGV